MAMKQHKEHINRAAYISEMAAELAEMARADNQSVLACLLEMVMIEADAPNKKSENARRN
jgi:hypothetical protein